MSLVKLQLVEGELGRAEGAEGKVNVYEKLLMECQDAMQAVRDEISSEKVMYNRLCIGNNKTSPPPPSPGNEAIPLTNQSL